MFNGDYSDLLSMLPFLVLMVLLYLVGREVILRNKPEPSSGVEPTWLSVHIIRARCLVWARLFTDSEVY